MKTMKKLLGITLIFAVLIGCMIFQVAALGDNETELDTPTGSWEGYCGAVGDGTNLTWKLDNWGTLTISGSGAMANYSLGTAPWYPNCTFVNKIIIGDKVTTIGQSAFYGCNATSLKMGSSVTTIGSWAFYSCNKLTAVTIGDSVTTIGDYAFRSCGSLASVTIGDGVTTIGGSAFYGCTRLASVVFGDNVTSIGSFAFLDCSSLTSVTIPDGVTTIGNYVFRNCAGLTTVVIPNGVTTIGNAAFSGCSSLASVDVPDSVTSVGVSAFSGCSALTSLTIGTGVEQIASAAFRYCQGLTAVTIPASVTYIGDNAFRDCQNLETVDFEGNAPGVGLASFDVATATLYYLPDATGWTDSKAYDAAAGTWNGYRLKVRGAEEPEVPEVTFTDTGRTLSLDGIVHINQYAAIEGDVDQAFIEANGGLLIWKSEPAEADYATADEVVEGLEYNTQYGDYGQATNGIAAKEFADELYMAIYLEVAEGVYAYGPVKEFSVQQYCETVLASPSQPQKLKDVAVAMLHYGTAAQTYFGYNTSDMANANIAEQYPADEWDAGLLDALVPYTTELTAVGNVANTAKSLALEGAVLVNYYFQKTDVEIVSGELQMWKGVTELTEDNITYREEMVYSPSYGGEWTAPSMDFAAKEYSTTAYARAVLKDAEGNEYTSDIVAFSPEEYANIVISRNTKEAELAKYLVMYGERARLYFPS